MFNSDKAYVFFKNSSTITYVDLEGREWVGRVEECAEGFWWVNLITREEDKVIGGGVETREELLDYLPELVETYRNNLKWEGV